MRHFAFTSRFEKQRDLNDDYSTIVVHCTVYEITGNSPKRVGEHSFYWSGGRTPKDHICNFLIKYDIIPASWMPDGYYDDVNDDFRIHSL